MNHNSLDPDNLFDKDSVVESDGSEYSESSIELGAEDEPKLFLASLSTRRINSVKVDGEIHSEQNKLEDPVVIPEGSAACKEDVLKEVAMKSSFRRTLSITPTDLSASNHSLTESLHLDVLSPDQSHHSLQGNEQNKQVDPISPNEAGISGETTDKMDLARSYVNIHASVRAFNGFAHKKKKQQTDEARMQSHMLMNIFINRREQNEPRFPRNVFITSKYTVWNFLFINLFEQFSRIANFVFLLVTLVQLIPGVSPFNIWSTLLPLIFILLVTALKEAWEDYGRHKADHITNHVPYQRVMRDGTVCEVPSCELVAGDIVVLKDQEAIPADILVLACSDSDGTCYVDTSSLDGETNLKEKQAVGLTKNVESPSVLGSLVGTLTCQIPNKELSVFQGVLSLHPDLRQSIHNESEVDCLEEAVDSHNLLLRGSILRNSNWVAGMIVYTGRLTKLSLNTNISKFKFSGIETSLNNFVPKVLFLQLALSLISCSVARGYDGFLYSLGLKSSIQPVHDWIFDFFTSFILFSYFVPMSLYVVFEFSRTIQAFFMENDLDMYVENEGGMRVSTSSLNEELGNVEFILSDKTGTLTKNNMKCYGFNMGGYCYMADSIPGEIVSRETIIEILAKENGYADLSDMEQEYVIHFLRSLFLCNSIKPVEQEGHVVLRSESADEEALIEGGLKLGWKLLLRTKDSIVIQEGYPFLPDPSTEHADGYHKFEILEELPFTSARQRMTIIVRDMWSNRICLYSKGADSRIIGLSCDEDVLTDNANSSCYRSSIYTSAGDIDETEEERQQMLQRIASFSKTCSLQGYRLLLVGGKYLTETEYAVWMKEIAEAKKAMKNREEAIERAFVHIERDMSVLGATAVEDELQDFIKEDIEFLRNGGITVAMATGDKKETAMIIARNCGLLNDSMKVFDLTGNKISSEEQLDSSLEFCDYKLHLRKLEYEKKNGSFFNKLMGCFSRRPPSESPSPTKEKQPYALVMDGLSADYLIRFAQDKLGYAIRHATTVICSRMSPKQKSRIIVLMKKQGLCCLAIGDGANDVSMIRESSVGVGVKGKEGNAAVNNADYIIRKFHHLIKLLFVHGRNNYRGNSYSVYTAFYENITFNIPLFFINFYTLFSGQTIYSSFQLSTLYFFTSPTFASFGFFFCDLNKETLLTHPEIYRKSKEDKMFSGKRMWSYLIGAFVNAMVNGYIPLLIFQKTQTIQGGYPLEYWSMGFCVWSNIIFSIILMSAMNVPKWNVNYICFFAIAIVFFFVDVLAILWVVQDELYDSLPIIIRSPVYYLQLLLSVGIVFLFFLVKISFTTAFCPDIWRPYAEKEALEKKNRDRMKVHPLENVTTVE